MTANEIAASVLQILAALLMAFIWAAFLRKLDIFRPEKWLHIVVAFIIGCLTPIPVLLLQKYLPEFYQLVYADHEILQSLAFYTINVGFIEECAKLAGFLIFYLIFRKWFDEDIN